MLSTVRMLQSRENSKVISTANSLIIGGHGEIIVKQRGRHSPSYDAAPTSKPSTKHMINFNSDLDSDMGPNYGNLFV